MLFPMLELVIMKVGVVRLTWMLSDCDTQSTTYLGLGVSL